MKVTLAQHGGQAAAINLRLPPRVVDTTTLRADEAGELARLVADAKSAPLAAGAAPGTARDAMSYTITIEDGGRQMVLSQSDTTMSEAFARLLAWLQRRR
jgi:emfourin